MTAAATPSSRDGPSLGTVVAWLALPAFVIGTVVTPDVSAALMPGPVAVVLILAAAAVLVWLNATRYVILLPLLGAYLPASIAGYVAGVLGLLLLIGVFGAARLARPLSRVEGWLLASVLWSVLSWLANLGQETDAWSLPVYLITFWAPWLMLFLAGAAQWTAAEMRMLTTVWLAAIVVQAVPGLLKPLLVGPRVAYLVPLLPLELIGIRIPARDAVVLAADSTAGTMLSAHHLGVVLVLALVVVGTLGMLTRRRSAFGLTLLLLYLLLLTDAKHVLLAVFLVGPAVLAFLGWPLLSGRARPRALVVALLSVGILAALATSAVRSLSQAGLWRPLIGAASFNPKVQLTVRTAALLQPEALTTWIGFGPGGYASRAASARATDVLYKETARLPSFIPPHTPPTYGRTVSDLYTATIATTTRFRSGMLTNPFSSLIGLVAEHGLIGTVIFAGFLIALARRGAQRFLDRHGEPLGRACGAALCFGVPFVVVLAVFDSYLEQPDIMIPLVVLGVIVLYQPPPVPQPSR